MQHDGGMGEVVDFDIEVGTCIDLAGNPVSHGQLRLKRQVFHCL